MSNEALMALVFPHIHEAISLWREADGDEEGVELSQRLAEQVTMLAEAHYERVPGLVDIPARIDKVTTPDGKAVQLTLSVVNCVQSRLALAQIDNAVTVRGVEADRAQSFGDDGGQGETVVDDGQLEFIELERGECPEPGNPEVVAYWAGYTSETMDCPYDVDDKAYLCKAYGRGFECRGLDLAWYEDPVYPGSPSVQAAAQPDAEPNEDAA